MYTYSIGYVEQYLKKYDSGMIRRIKVFYTHVQR